MKNIPIAKTNLTDHEINSVLEPLKSGWLVQGPKTKEFEESWSAFTGSPHSIAVTSCTSALHLSLSALGFGPGDEAIVPALTWISTANVVEHLGGKVVFCDVDLDTFNINVEHINLCITPRTKAILPVHLFGLSADMPSIINYASQHNLHIVEDAACGFGATVHNQHVGTFGNTGCFSFHPRKAITTGEGGMITTSDPDLAVKLRRLRDHGASLSDLQRHHGPKPYLLSDHPDAGFNYRMTDIQAALGASQMQRADKIIQDRRRIASIYSKAFSDFSLLKTPSPPSQYQHGFQSYPCMFDFANVSSYLKSGDFNGLKLVSQRRNHFMELLQQRGVSTRPATHAVHLLSYYRNKYSLKPQDYPCALAANDCSISLPLYHGMSDSDIDYVISSVFSASKEIS